MTYHIERRLSCAVADHLRLVLPEQVQWTHLPMGEVRKPETAALLKRMGTKAGWADYLIIYEGRAHFMELKRPKDDKKPAGCLSDAQREFRDTCIANSTPYAVCHSIDEVESVLQIWGIPTRGRIAA